METYSWALKKKRRPVLESVMNYHGLLSQEKKLSIDEMHNIIVSHIVFGHCAHPVRPSLLEFQGHCVPSRDHFHIGRVSVCQTSFIRFGLFVYILYYSVYLQYIT